MYLYPGTKVKIRGKMDFRSSYVKVQVIPIQSNNCILILKVVSVYHVMFYETEYSFFENLERFVQIYEYHHLRKFSYQLCISWLLLYKSIRSVDFMRKVYSSLSILLFERFTKNIQNGGNLFESNYFRKCFGVG